MTIFKAGMVRFAVLQISVLLPFVCSASKSSSVQDEASSAIQTVAEAISSLSVDRRGALTRIATSSDVESLCGVSINSNAPLEEQLASAQAVESCLASFKKTLETLLISGNEDTRTAVAPTLPVVAAAHASLENLSVELAEEKNFLGQKWGIGVGYSTGFDDIVGTAAIVDGVVRVTKDLTDQPRVLFEFHNYRWCNENRTDNSPVRTGCGPFAAIASRDDKVVSGVAIGWMYGWKSRDPKDSDGFSVGIGVILDADGKELAEGYVDGQPPPTGATAVQTKESSVWSGVLFVTRTF